MNSKMQKSEMHKLTYTYADEKNARGEVLDRKFTVKGRKRDVTVHLKSEYTRSMNKSEGSTVEKTATCSCSKPQLLHKPCSHVIAICCKIGVSSATYMSPYYSLPYLGRTWSGIFDESKISRDYRNIIPFGCTTWIPDKRLESGLPVFVTPECLATVTEELEQQCSTGNGSTEDNQGSTSRSEEPN
ncbi:hypothetical protein VPH35_124560 [Triticum aestivum]